MTPVMSSGPEDPQPPAHAPKAPAEGDAAAAAAQGPGLPFSFGAAGITILWLFFHGRPVEAIGLIVLNVILRAAAEQSLTAGILALFVVLLVMFSFGSSGSRIAMQRKRYRTVEELKAGERGWNIAGVIFGVLSLLIGIVSVFGLL